VRGRYVGMRICGVVGDHAGDGCEGSLTRSTSSFVQQRARVNKDEGESHRGAGTRAILRRFSWAWLLISALSLLVASRAWADSRIVVRAFRGPKGAEVRQVVIKELTERGFEVVPNKDVDRVARARGVRADEPSGRAEVSRELGIHAWVDARVSRTKGGFTAVIAVREGDGDDQVAELTATRAQSKKLVAVVRRELWKATGPAFEKARAPEPPPPSHSEATKEAAPTNEALVMPAEPAPVEPPRNLQWPAEVTENFAQTGRNQPVPSTQGQESKEKRRLSLFEASASLNSLSRTLRFRDAVAQGVSDYEFATAPLVIGSARIYPAAFSRARVACCIGLDGSVQRAFGLGSQSAEGVTYKTRFEGSTGSLIGRVPFAQHEVDLLAGYGLQRFLIRGAAGSSPPVPSVSYRHLRLGGAGRFALGSRTKLGLEASWLMILETGQLASTEWFPRSTGRGLEGSFHIDVRLFAGLAARARASYQRSVFELAPQKSGQRSASGLVDTYITAGIGLSYAH